LSDRLKHAGIKTVSIARLQDLAAQAASRAGAACIVANHDSRVVALQQYRDGTIIDVLREVR
jgi:citrate lyase subunit alpha/citrate CoA-transferase